MHLAADPTSGGYGIKQADEESKGDHVRNLFQGHLRGKKSRGGARERILATANVLQSKLVLTFESEISHTDSLFFFWKACSPGGW